MTKGDRIKQARIEKGITQDELGRLCETSKQNIYKYETGKITNIPSDMIEKIGNALDVSPCYLMGWEGFGKGGNAQPANRSAQYLTDDEQKLLDGYRELSKQGKEYLQQTLDMAIRVYIKNHAVSNVEKNA